MVGTQPYTGPMDTALGTNKTKDNLHGSLEIIRVVTALDKASEDTEATKEVTEITKVYNNFQTLNNVLTEYFIGYGANNQGYNSQSAYGNQGYNNGGSQGYGNQGGYGQNWNYYGQYSQQHGWGNQQVCLFIQKHFFL